MTADTGPGPAGRFRPVRSLITAWALLGGLVLVGVVLVNAWSILAGAIVNKPFPGDFELTKMGTAVAAFCFLPYCQLVGANVSADIFTMRAGPRAIALMSVLASIIAVAFAAILLWRMSAGLLDYHEYEQFTGILEIPLWWAFVPALVSLALMVLASAVTLVEAFGELARTKSG